MNFCMRILRNKKWLILAALFVSLSAGILFAALGGGEAAVQRGCVDLFGVDLKNGEAVDLSGEWEFFAYKHIVTDLTEEEKPDGFVKVPSYIKRRADGPAAWGSYRVTLKNCPPALTVAVTLKGMPSAYRIFVNGECVEKSGMLSTNASVISVQADASRESALLLQSSVCELVVETSGLLLPGLSIPPRLQEYGRWQREYNQYRALALLLFGMHILYTASYLLQLILNPRSGYSWSMFAVLLLLLLKGLSVDVPYAALLGQETGGYDRFQLWSYGVQILMWGIGLGIYYGDSGEQRGWRFSVKDIALVMGCLAAAVGALRGTTGWWFCLEAAVWLVLAVRLFRFFGRGQGSTTEAFFEEAGLLVLWFGCALMDLSLMGVCPYPCKTAFFLGIICFDLSVNVIDRFRMKKVQQKALEALRMEGELQQAKMELALRQIKPHFLQNALMSIKVLCRTRPLEAERAVYDFAVFLRSNMNAMESSVPVTFSEELRTIRGYLHIEKLRFGDRICVEWDIQEENFLIPPLTIQPLVENAVRHGICQKTEGGTVTIVSRRVQGEIRVEVRDDGVGFDVSKAKFSDGIGIRNLRLRLETLLHARLEIHSSPGKGCVQIVHIPLERGGQKDADNFGG